MTMTSTLDSDADTLSTMKKDKNASNQNNQSSMLLSVDSGYPASSGYADSQEFGNSTSSFTQAIESVEIEKPKKHKLQPLTGHKLDKLNLLARKWGIGSVIGETFIFYDNLDKRCYKGLKVQG